MPETRAPEIHKALADDTRYRLYRYIGLAGRPISIGFRHKCQASYFGLSIETTRMSVAGTATRWVIPCVPPG